MRTAEEIDATTGRYPSGRARPVRENWVEKTKIKPKIPKPKPKSEPRPTPIFAKWFVHAKRNDTKVKLPAPRGRDEAYTMAGHLFMYGWKVKVINNEHNA